MILVNGATQSPKDGMEGNRGSLKNGAEAIVLFLHVAQLELRSSVLIILDLEEVDVTLKNHEIFLSVLSGEGGSADGWRWKEPLRSIPSHKMD